ncbi:hypothetical protein [Bdellovibrio sp. BCCA]|uniref:hypothetical protein n=1 Tax=Bdellovibrio sp. BCCA TaxID=3136281 RepID=UPI0030F2B739
MEERIFTYKEVCESAVRTGHNPSPRDARFGMLFSESTHFVLKAVPVSRLHYMGSWTPDQPLRCGETNAYQDENGNPIDSDEYYARKYAKEYKTGLTAEPVICTSRFDLADGRHRTRSAYLRGEEIIQAFVEVSK